MDSAILHDLAVRGRNLPLEMYPIFDLCHIILCVLAVRKEAGKQSARNSLFATWLACVVASFAGSIFANPLLGKPILAAFSDEKLLVLVTIVYLLVFFCPADIAYKILTWQPVYLTICAFKEVLRAKKILGGMKEGAAFNVAGSKFFLPILIGTIKGNGSAMINPITRVMLHVWKPFENEVSKPSTTTKLCFFSALVFAIVGADSDLVYLSIVGLLLSVKMSTLLGQPVDPIAPIEKIFCGLLYALADGKLSEHKE